MYFLGHGDRCVTSSDWYCLLSTSTHLGDTGPALLTSTAPQRVQVLSNNQPLHVTQSVSDQRCPMIVQVPTKTSTVGCVTSVTRRHVTAHVTVLNTSITEVTPVLL